MHRGECKQDLSKVFSTRQYAYFHQVLRLQRLLSYFTTDLAVRGQSCYPIGIEIYPKGPVNNLHVREHLTLNIIGRNPATNSEAGTSDMLKARSALSAFMGLLLGLKYLYVDYSCTLTDTGVISIGH